MIALEGSTVTVSDTLCSQVVAAQRLSPACRAGGRR